MTVVKGQRLVKMVHLKTGDLHNRLGLAASGERLGGGCRHMSHQKEDDKEPYGTAQYPVAGGLLFIHFGLLLGGLLREKDGLCNGTSHQWLSIRHRKRGTQRGQR